MAVKTLFNIKDLENLSGVKAHTIRIWEKRYNLLQPARTDTNIRKYDLDNLMKLLNVSFLYNEGIKISKIAKSSEQERIKLIQELSVERKEEHAIKLFKTAMFNFDYDQFTEAYDDLSKEKSFSKLFFDVLVPLLNDIGLLWHTGVIDHAHEHFISELIKQKLIINIIEQQERIKSDNSRVFILYLPYEEIHEIGLLFAHFEILSAGYKSIYLGPNIPISSLKNTTQHYDKITFVSYFTVKPDKRSIEEYINDYKKEIEDTDHYNLWILGPKAFKSNGNKSTDNIKIIPSYEQFINYLNVK
jgi:DNA-binding transcriptional MerR regulator